MAVAYVVTHLAIQMCIQGQVDCQVNNSHNWTRNRISLFFSLRVSLFLVSSVDIAFMSLKFTLLLQFLIAFAHLPGFDNMQFHLMRGVCYVANLFFTHSYFWLAARECSKFCFSTINNFNGKIRTVDSCVHWVLFDIQLSRSLALCIPIY